MEFLKEFWDFLKTRKRYWLIPFLLILLFLSLLIVLTQGTALAPFIYSVF
jgi:competence protein ComGC